MSSKPPFAKFVPARPGEILPQGSNAEFLKKQLNGLTGNFAASGYPFDTPMWDGGVGVIRSAPIIHNDEETPSPSQDAWWPYEQSAYLLDGVLKTAILTGEPDGIEVFRKNLRFLIDHPDKDGKLGNYCHCDIHWPMAVFFRAAMAYAEFEADAMVKQAFIRHYQALDINEIGTGFRHINNLEGLLTAYRWSQDHSLLEKAEAAYLRHNEFFRSHPDGLRELYMDKLAAMDKHILHGVTFSEGVKLPVMLYMYTGKKSYLEIAESGLQAVLDRHETLTGLPSANEFFSGKDPLQGYETCLINDFPWALNYFLQATGKVEYADRIEKIIFNALGGCVTDDFTALMYISSPNQVIAAPESNHSFFYRGGEDVMEFRPSHSAQCCPGNIHHVLPNFIMSQFMYGTDGTPAAILYSAASWQGSCHAAEFEVTEETAYPYGEKISFRFSVKGGYIPFMWRIPHWCKNAEVLFNGKAIGKKAVAGTFFRVDEISDGDEVTLILPLELTEKKDRHWKWFESGALLFSMPVEYLEERSENNRFSPRSYRPVSKWNYSPLPGGAKLCFSGEYPVVKVMASEVSGFDALEQNRYTPQVPLYCSRQGTAKELTLIPYRETELRITAFPDAEKRKPLFIYQALVSEAFEYREHLPLAGQAFASETTDPRELCRQFTEIFPEKDGYYDLLHHFGKLDDHLAYLLLRFWSDSDDEATLCIGADTAAQGWINGKYCFELPPGSEAVFTIGSWFKIPVKQGFNSLLVKVAKGTFYEQYRNAWGVRADIFTT